MNDLERLDKKTVFTEEFPFKYCVYYLDEDILMGDTLEKATKEVYDFFEGKYTKLSIKNKFKSCNYAINENNQYLSDRG